MPDSDHFTDCDELSHDGGEEVLEPTLKSLVESKTAQWIFVGGKGGVGKTTTSCSLAIQLAKRRESVLILSTDPAHNLSDAFSQKFTNAPTQVKGFKNLFAMEIDSNVKSNSGFQLSEEEDALGLGKLLPELMQAFPGIDEAMSFGELMRAVQTMNYSCIVFDTAPTGHTLRLLSFPDLLEGAFNKFGEIKEKLGGAFDMMSAMTNGGQGDGSDSISGRFEHMRAVTLSVRKMFKDPSRTTFVCVCIPEFLSVYETERLIQELAEQEIDSRYIVVNQIVFPVEDIQHVKTITDVELESELKAKLGGGELSEALDSISSIVMPAYRDLQTIANALKKSHNARRSMQSKYLAQIRELYAYDFHVVSMPLRGTEVRGIQHLQEFGEDLLRAKPLPIFTP